jgi:glycosyltransferase involved in cell wall biosynthesis
MNCSNPQVSVIVPNYNHAKFLRARLDSILNQTFQDFELILLDDCSTDTSVEILQLYAGQSRVSHFVVNDQNSGSPFVQWERGLVLARGEFIWIAESDDVAEPEFLERMVRILHEYSHVAMVYCRSVVIDQHGGRHGELQWLRNFCGSVLDHDYVVSGAHEIRRHLAFMNTIPNASSVLFRSSALRQIRMPVDMRFCGDWKVYLDLLKAADLAYLSRPLNLYRSEHSESTRMLKSPATEFQRIQEFACVADSASLSVMDQLRSIRKYRMLIDSWNWAHSRYKPERPVIHQLPLVPRCISALTRFHRRIQTIIRFNPLTRCGRWLLRHFTM